MKRVAVIGLGYVGLPLALLADRKGFEISGVDVSKERIKGLQAKVSPIKEKALESQLKGSRVKFTDSFEAVKGASIVIVCVPTPVSSDKIPDLGPVKDAVSSAAKHIKEDSLLIIESTINPGVCDEVVIPLLESISGYKSGKNIFVAHCPERINPGDSRWDVSNISRVVGADSPEGLDRAASFYRQLVDAEVKEMATIKEAEAVKVVENSFRDINIAFVNELAMSFHKLGINLENVIDGASTKPFAFMAHRPGCGVGGHCIPVDPYYLIEHARGHGFEHKFLQVAREINESMPAFTISLLEEAYSKLALDKKSVRVLVLGQAYKPNVGDDRESPAVAIYNSLVYLGYNVRRYDSYTKDRSDFDSLDEALDFADSLVLATGHSEYKSLSAKKLSKNGISIVVDGRNLLKDSLSEFNDLNILYKGIGVQ